MIKNREIIDTVTGILSLSKTDNLSVDEAINRYFDDNEISIPLQKHVREYFSIGKAVGKPAIPADIKEDPKPTVPEIAPKVDASKIPVLEQVHPGNQNVNAFPLPTKLIEVTGNQRKFRAMIESPLTEKELQDKYGGGDYLYYYVTDDGVEHIVTDRQGHPMSIISIGRTDDDDKKKAALPTQDDKKDGFFNVIENNVQKYMDKMVADSLNGNADTKYNAIQLQIEKLRDDMKAKEIEMLKEQNKHEMELTRLNYENQNKLLMQRLESLEKGGGSKESGDPIDRIQKMMETVDKVKDMFGATSIGSAEPPKEGWIEGVGKFVDVISKAVNNSPKILELVAILKGMQIASAPQEEEQPRKLPPPNTEPVSIEQPKPAEKTPQQRLDEIVESDIQRALIKINNALLNNITFDDIYELFEDTLKTYFRPAYDHIKSFEDQYMASVKANDDKTKEIIKDKIKGVIARIEHFGKVIDNEKFYTVYFEGLEEQVKDTEV